VGWHTQFNAKFADLIRADTMEAATRAANQSWMLLAKAMIAAEREACAKVCETLGDMNKGVYGEMQIGVYSAAKSIRARGDV
jgi:hypothetical protein